MNALGDAGTDSPPGPDALLTCDEDRECPSGACHELERSCVPESAVIYVNEDANGTTDMGCTRQAPCDSLEGGLAEVVDGRSFIALAAGSYSSGPLLFLSGPEVIVSGPSSVPDDVRVSAGGTKITSAAQAVLEGFTLRPSGMAQVVGVEVNGMATLSRMIVERASGNGVEVAGGTVRLVGSQVAQSTGVGVYMSSGTLLMDRTLVLQNTRQGLQIEGGSYTVTSSMFLSNGTTNGRTPGVELRAASTASVFRYNTVAYNSSFGETGGIECEGDVSVDSTIIANNTSPLMEQASSRCDVTYSLFSSQVLPGEGNRLGSASLSSPTDGHIGPQSAAIDRGNPDGAPLRDFDGEPRGAAPDIGADEL